MGAPRLQSRARGNEKGRLPIQPRVILDRGAGVSGSDAALTAAAIRRRDHGARTEMVVMTLTAEEEAMLRSHEAFRLIELQEIDRIILHEMFQHPGGLTFDEIGYRHGDQNQQIKARQKVLRKKELIRVRCDAAGKPLRRMTRLERMERVFTLNLPPPVQLPLL